MFISCAIEGGQVGSEGTKVVVGGPPPFPLSFDEIRDRLIIFAEEIGAVDGRSVDNPKYAVDFGYATPQTSFRFYNETALGLVLRRVLLRHCIGREVLVGLTDNNPISRLPRLIFEGKLLDVGVEHAVFESVVARHPDTRIFMRAGGNGRTHNLLMRKVCSVALKEAA